MLPPQCFLCVSLKFDFLHSLALWVECMPSRFFHEIQCLWFACGTFQEKYFIFLSSFEEFLFSPPQLLFLLAPTATGLCLSYVLGCVNLILELILLYSVQLYNSVATKKFSDASCPAEPVTYPVLVLPPGMNGLVPLLRVTSVSYFYV